MLNIFYEYCLTYVKSLLKEKWKAHILNYRNVNKLNTSYVVPRLKIKIVSSTQNSGRKYISMKQNGGWLIWRPEVVRAPSNLEYALNNIWKKTHFLKKLKYRFKINQADTLLNDAWKKKRRNGTCLNICSLSRQQSHSAASQWHRSSNNWAQFQNCERDRKCICIRENLLAENWSEVRGCSRTYGWPVQNNNFTIIYIKQ